MLQTRAKLFVFVAALILCASGCATLWGEEPAQAKRDKDHPDPWMELFHHTPTEEEIAQQKEMEHAKRQTIRRSIAYRDVVVGMSARDVISAWGEPARVDSAGYPGSGTERWIYFTSLSTPGTGLGEGRVVYFHAGEVSGWEPLNR